MGRVNSSSCFTRAPLLRFLRNGLGYMICALATGCGTHLSTLPSAATKTPVGVPGGAILGYVWSSADSSLRPLLGVSGSAQVGQSIVPTGAYVTGAASTASSVGLIEDGNGNLFMLDLPLPPVTAIAARVPATAQIVFSPSGEVAIAYARGGTGVMLISNLPLQPLATTLALPSGIKLASAIVSDAGTVLVATQATPSAIEVLTAGGQLSPLETVVQPGGMSFLPGVDDALVADRGQNTLSLLHSVSGSAAVQPISAPGMNQPLAVAVSHDSRWAVVANSGDKNILRLDLKNETAPSKLSCSCQPNQLRALSGNGVFQLTDLSNGPIWTVDVGGATSQLLFVPGISSAVSSATVASTATKLTLLR